MVQVDIHILKYLQYVIPITLKILCSKQKLWSSGRVLGSRSEGHGFDLRPMLDESGVKAMPS